MTRTINDGIGNTIQNNLHKQHQILSEFWFSPVEDTAIKFQQRIPQPFARFDVVTCICALDYNNTTQVSYVLCKIY